jgi:hypothetical protein
MNAYTFAALLTDVRRTQGLSREEAARVILDIPLTIAPSSGRDVLARREFQRLVEPRELPAAGCTGPSC